MIETGIYMNDLGFYKKPRVLKGVKFLSHITETRKCGNRMPVYFPHRGTIDVIDWRYEPLMECDSNPVTFMTQWDKNDVYVQCIDDWEFVQYRPNTQWIAIKIETEEEDDMMPLVTETIPARTELAPIDFQDFYIKNTFDKLQETVVLYNEQFYTVMGMRTNLAKPGNYSLYLKRWMYDCIRKVEIGPNQKFIYQKNSNSWLVDPVEALYTDFTDVKDQLRADGVKKVIVAGVEKELKRVSEISSGLLHLVFAYDGELEHFYSTKNTRLRVREGKIATEYLLDHVKRMHV